MEDRRTRKTELILSLIFQVNLRLGGYSICNASTSCTIYVKEKFRAGAPHSLNAAEEALEELQGLTTYPRCTRSAHCPNRILETLGVSGERLQKHSTPAKLDYKELTGFSDLGQRDFPQAGNILE